MSVYILHEYNVMLPDGSKVCIMTADNETELHQMATTINAKNFCDELYSKFYVLSRSQMKKARNNGALMGDDAKVMIEFKKQFPIMQQHEAKE